MIDILKQTLMFHHEGYALDRKLRGGAVTHNAPITRFRRTSPSCPPSHLRHQFEPGPLSEDQPLVQVRGERGWRYKRGTESKAEKSKDG